MLVVVAVDGSFSSPSLPSTLSSLLLVSVVMNYFESILYSFILSRINPHKGPNIGVVINTVVAFRPKTFDEPKTATKQSIAITREGRRTAAEPKSAAEPKTAPKPSIASTREGRRMATEPKSVAESSSIITMWLIFSGEAAWCNKHNDRSSIITTEVLSSSSSSCMIVDA